MCQSGDRNQGTHAGRCHDSRRDRQVEDFPEGQRLVVLDGKGLAGCAPEDVVALKPTSAGAAASSSGGT